MPYKTETRRAGTQARPGRLHLVLQYPHAPEKRQEQQGGISQHLQADARGQAAEAGRGHRTEPGGPGQEEV